MTLVLISGGARSGKSRHAEGLALAAAASLGAAPVYIATAEAHDDEMRDRIAAHRARRDAAWRNVEAPMALAEALDETDRGGPRVVDCLTLWLTNLMLAERDWESAAQALCAAAHRQVTPVFIVTNEVGLGIVPDNALARRFRDAAGFLNQMVAGVADEVIFMVAGLPMKVK